MFMKPSSYYRARDAEQNGVLVEEFIMPRRPVRSDASLKVRYFLYKKRAYLGKKKESGEQREATWTKLAVIFKYYHSTWPKEQ